MTTERKPHVAALTKDERTKLDELALSLAPMVTIPRLVLRAVLDELDGLALVGQEWSALAREAMNREEAATAAKLMLRDLLADLQAWTCTHIPNPPAALTPADLEAFGRIRLQIMRSGVAEHGDPDWERKVFDGIRLADDAVGSDE